MTANLKAPTPLDLAPRPLPLTDRQREIYRFIWNCTLNHGYQPSFREVMAAFGMTSPNAVKAHLVKIAKKGWNRGPIRYAAGTGDPVPVRPIGPTILRVRGETGARPAMTTDGWFIPIAIVVVFGLGVGHWLDLPFTASLGAGLTGASLAVIFTNHIRGDS